jgi:hypothetical protein
MKTVSTACRKTSRPRCYIEDYRPQKKTVALLNDAGAVLQEYRAHWPLTCRQIYYRLVGARGYPKTEAFYDSLCHHLANARRARVIPFSAVRDDGITTVDMQHFDDEEHFKRHLRELAERYTRNKLAGQDLHIEAHCEASGMIFQLAGVAHEYSVEVYSSSGFDSLTAKKLLADRICEIGKRAVILHLGDCDPSGESIFESAAEDVQAFIKADWPDIEVEFRRVALTAAQVKEYDLPTAPPKPTDSRSKSWTGETCQLEALPPDEIANLLRAAIENAISPARLERDLRIEAVERRRIALALPAPGATP